MSHAKNKVDWCLRKAVKELEESGRHRGLVKIKPNKEDAKNHIKKAEHNLNAAMHFYGTDFSDWSASAFFYSIYHALLAISYKFGYESENQDCTFALIYYLAEESKISFNKELLNMIATLDIKEKEDKSKEKREFYQYGTKLSIDKEDYNKLLKISKEVISEAKEVVEE